VTTCHMLLLSGFVAHGEVCSIQHYVITFVSDLRQAGWWFSLATPVSSNNKTDRRYITGILLKVALNTITLPRLHCKLSYMLLYPYLNEYMKYC